MIFSDISKILGSTESKRVRLSSSFLYKVCDLKKNPEIKNLERPFFNYAKEFRYEVRFPCRTNELQ